MGREATLFARHLNLFEDRLFTDSVAWNTLGDNAKDAFVARATKGIVWESVLQSLRADNLIYWSYDVSRFVQAIISTQTTPPPIYAELHDPVAPVDAIRAEAYAELNAPSPPPRFPPRPPLQLPATVFIDARGFDLWWFVDTLLINSPLRSHFVRANRPSI